MCVVHAVCNNYGVCCGCAGLPGRADGVPPLQPATQLTYSVLVVVVVVFHNVVAVVASVIVVKLSVVVAVDGVVSLLAFLWSFYVSLLSFG